MIASAFDIPAPATLQSLRIQGKNLSNTAGLIHSANLQISAVHINTALSAAGTNLRTLGLHEANAWNNATANPSSTVTKASR